MKLQDAASVLQLSGFITPAITRDAWIAAAKRYHPDVNPAGLEMMKVVNEAYESLKDFEGEITDTRNSKVNHDYADALNDALNAILHTPLDIEVCGAWVWISGDTRAYKDILKAANFRWASAKKQWYFRPEGWKSASRGSYTMDAIRTRYGSERPARRHYDHVTQED